VKVVNSEKMNAEQKAEIQKVLQALKKEALDPKIIKEGQNRLSWVFFKGVASPMLIRNINVQKQFKVEVAFSEEHVENPEVRKKKIEQYIS
jgi:hypothetical protein